MKKNIYYLNTLNLKLKIPPKMEKGPSFDEPYIMKKNIIKFCYVYIISHLPFCNYSKSLKITLQITCKNVKILNKTEEENIKGQVHLVYYGVLEASSKLLSSL